MDLGHVVVAIVVLAIAGVVVLKLSLSIMSDYQKHQASLAEKHWKNTDIREPVKGYMVITYATPQGVKVERVDLRENLKALPQRYYVPTELDDDTYNFALSILFESKKRFGNASQEILGIREFPKDESKWRRATDWLATNYRINKTPLHTTTTGPYYTSVAELYVDVVSKRVPIALGNTPTTAPWATATSVPTV